MNLENEELISTEVSNRFNKTNSFSINRNNIVEANKDVTTIISAVFVVSFDHKKGNILEWCMPGDFNYSGIEFKALVSGLHHVKSDFVYFRHFQYFGIGCFALRPLKEEQGERNVRMKTVGLISNNYLNLHQYIDFLESSVRHILIHQGDYDRLIAFYSDHIVKNNMPSIPKSVDLKNIELNLSGVYDYDLLLYSFGLQIFALWKLVLLRKRIMFLSKPPIGPICQQLICCHQLGSHDIIQLQYLQTQPMFNISLSDTDQLQPSFWQQVYIACSTDQIIQVKRSWYDCLIRNSHIELMDEPDNPIHKAISISSSDKIKYEKLMNIKQNFDCFQNNWEECVISFFKSENNRLFSALLDLANSGEPEITTSHIEHLGFNPKEDKYFLLLLLETYGIDLIYHVDSDCC